MESCCRHFVISLFAKCGLTYCTCRYFAFSTVIGSCSSKERRKENIWRHENHCLQKLKLLMLFEMLTTHLRARIRSIEHVLFMLRIKFGNAATKAGFLLNTLYKIKSSRKLYIRMDLSGQSCFQQMFYLMTLSVALTNVD
jgi:hypothetical protein